METFIFVIFFGLILGISVLLGLHKTPSMKDRKKYKKGVTLYTNGDFAKALEFFNKVLKKNKHSAVIWAFKGLCHLEMNDYYQALYASKEALKVDYELKEAYFTSGLAYYYLNNFSLAKSNLELANWYYPKSDLILILKYQSLCEKKLGNFNQAKDFLKQARDLGDEEANYELLKIEK